MLLKVTFNIGKRDQCSIAGGVLFFRRRRRQAPFAFFFHIQALSILLFLGFSVASAGLGCAKMFYNIVPYDNLRM